MKILQNYLTVTALTKYIKMKLEGDKHLFSIYLKGEISNFKRHSRGHLYFTIKDDNAQIAAIMFNNYTNNLNFSPKDGDHILVTGKISLYEPQGAYSIQVSEMTLDGIGELYLKYEALKRDLEEKGYFREEHKKVIPKYPKRIGVITSPTGAVIEDIKNTVRRRYLLSEIYLYPALVQGPDSSRSIKTQIEKANIDNLVDVLIVGRGGGSLEDLWGFNELETIMAIFNSKIPVITAIGHETDFTLSDFVSDLRAPTPTAAAELATPNKEDLINQINVYYKNLNFLINKKLENYKTDLVYLTERLDKVSPKLYIKDLKQKVSDLNSHLNSKYLLILTNYKHKVNISRERLKNPLDKIKRYKDLSSNLNNKLNIYLNNVLINKTNKYNLLKNTLANLNPLRLMDLGYSVIYKDNKVITSIDDVIVEDNIVVNLKDGKLLAEVKEKVYGKKL